MTSNRYTSTNPGLADRQRAEELCAPAMSNGPDNDAPPLYPDHCRKHARIGVPGNCGDCKDQREANKVLGFRHLAAVPAVGKRCLVHDQTYTNVCSGCRADEIAAEETA